MKNPNHYTVKLVSASFNENTATGILEYGTRLLKALKTSDPDMDFRELSLMKGNIAGTPRRLYKPHKDDSVKKADLTHYIDPGFIMYDALFKSSDIYKRKFVVTVHDLDMFYWERKFWRNLKQYTKPSQLMSKRFMTFFLSPFIEVARLQTTKVALKNADRVICVSEKSREEILKNSDVPKNKISVVYPIIGEEFKPMRKKKHGKIIIGHISSYLPNKNVGMLIEAFKATKSKDLELWLYGQIPPFVIEDDKRIKYKGFASSKKLPRIFNSFDVFVFPSLWEGFGMPVMEAKRCKVPVITYKKGLLPDIVKRNTTQFKNERDLTKILDNQQWFDVDLNSAYHDADMCKPDYVAAQLTKIYSDVINSKNTKYKRKAYAGHKKR